MPSPPPTLPQTLSSRLIASAKFSFYFWRWKLILLPTINHISLFSPCFWVVYCTLSMNIYMLFSDYFLQRASQNLYVRLLVPVLCSSYVKMPLHLCMSIQVWRSYFGLERFVLYKPCGVSKSFLLEGARSLFFEYMLLGQFCIAVSFSGEKTQLWLLSQWFEMMVQYYWLDVMYL